jgi:hypothetical protein
MLQLAADTWEFLVANPGVTAIILVADILVLILATGWLRPATGSAR